MLYERAVHTVLHDSVLQRFKTALTAHDARGHLTEVWHEELEEGVVARDVQDGHAVQAAVAHVVTPLALRALQLHLHLDVVVVRHLLVRPLLHLPIRALDFDEPVFAHEAVGGPSQPLERRVLHEPHRLDHVLHVLSVGVEGHPFVAHAPLRGNVAFERVRTGGAIVRRLPRHVAHEAEGRPAQRPMGLGGATVLPCG